MRLLTLSCVLMLVGCAASPKPQRSGDATHYQIAEAALRYLMDKHSNHGVERDYYSAYVLGRGEFTSRLIAAFAGYKPPVVADIQVSNKNGVLVDKATGKN